MSSASEPLKGLNEVSKAKGLPPVHLWNPPFCGDINMRIAADGLWHYMNSPIGRLPLVKLFSSLGHRVQGKAPFWPDSLFELFWQKLVRDAW